MNRKGIIVTGVTNPNSIRSSPREDELMIHYGAIASGNQVMRSGTFRDDVARQLDVICFEMETAGLIDVLPSLPIRGICDYSDSHKGKGWQRFAAATAAAFARELLEELSATDVHTDVHASNSCMHDSVERRQLLLESLRFEQIDSRKMNIKGALNRTCEWFLSDPSYKAWLDPAGLTQHCGFLWISGKPGAGKSTIVKFVYERMKEEARTKNTVVASYFFNARGEYLEKSIVGMYRSLLLQLLEGYPDLQTVLNDPELIPRSFNGCPELNILKSLFRNSATQLGRRELTCFVDALDECDEQWAVDIVQFFEDLTEQLSPRGAPFRICFSSLHYPYIVIGRGIWLTLEDQPGHTKDLETYAAKRLRINNPSLAEELRTQLLDKAAGVFMWVVLVVDILNKEYQRGGMFLRKRIAEIPSDLSELFKDILKRDEENMNALLLCTLWILYAKRPLRPEEFYYALWSGLSLDSAGDDGLMDITLPDPKVGFNEFTISVINYSKGLAEITKTGRPTVQFIHESVRDFLVKDKGLHTLWPDLGSDCESTGHERLKQCCYLYMTHSIKDTSVGELSVPSPGLQTETMNRRPFLEYASHYVLYHANIAARKFPQEDFLSSLPLSNWVTIRNTFEKFNIRRYTQDASLIYVLADNGHSVLVRMWPKEERQRHTPTERYRYPLFAALSNGNKQTIASILDLPSCIYNGVDLTEGLDNRRDFKGYENRTPLSWAAQEGRDTLVQLLLHNGVAIDEIDQAGHTALSRASQNGHEAVARLLIENGADVNASGNDGRTPLHRASYHRSEAIARLLIENGADINASQKDKATPLLLAVSHPFGRNNESVARLLIENGADINTSKKDRSKLLRLALCHGYGSVARLLVENGAGINARKKSGTELLLLASSAGDETVARILIDNGADVNASDYHCRMPLQVASGRGKKAVAELLIDKGADVNISDIDGWTPLLRASNKGHEVIVKVLLDKGADINARDRDGRTALFLASKNGHEGVARLLIERGADPVWSSPQ